MIALAISQQHLPALRHWLYNSSISNQPILSKMNKTSSLSYDLVGKRIGHVSVLHCLGTHNKMKKYLTRCECGNLHEAYGKRLVSLGQNNTDYRCDKCRFDKTRRQKMKIMRFLDSKALNAWERMVKVCYPRQGYSNRTICKEWFDFFSFLKSLGEPKDNQCLFHVRQFGEYNAKTCRWEDKGRFIANINYV